MDEKAIRLELEKVLKEDPSNYVRILELSTKLSSFDNDNIRFSVDAGVIDRLGSELVARQETAVSELVKNAYDADATKVDIRFENSDNIGGTLQQTELVHAFPQEHKHIATHGVEVQL